jgi:hypothetical protein
MFIRIEPVCDVLRKPWTSSAQARQGQHTGTTGSESDPPTLVLCDCFGGAMRRSVVQREGPRSSDQAFCAASQVPSERCSVLGAKDPGAGGANISPQVRHAAV